MDANASLAEQDLARYRAEIAYTDEQIERLINAMEEAGLSQNTILVLTADHGEEFGEHGRRYHGATLASEVLHVPMLLRGPGIPVGKRIVGVVGLQDLDPSLLDLVGLAIPSEIDGESFVSRFVDDQPSSPRGIFSEATVPFAVTSEGNDPTWLPPSAAVTQWPLRLVKSRTKNGDRY